MPELFYSELMATSSSIPTPGQFQVHDSRENFCLNSLRRVNKRLKTILRVTSEGSLKILIFSIFAQLGLQLSPKESKQAKLTLEGNFKVLGGLRDKLLLRGVAKGLGWLRKVAWEGASKITKTDNFIALKPPIAAQVTKN